MDQQHPSMEQGTAHAIAKEHRQEATHRSEEMKVKGNYIRDDTDFILNDNLCQF